MLVAYGCWDALVLSLRTTTEGVELQVGAAILLPVLWLLARTLDWLDEDEPPEATG